MQYGNLFRNKFVFYCVVLFRLFIFMVGVFNPIVNRKWILIADEFILFDIKHSNLSNQELHLNQYFYN